MEPKTVSIFDPQFLTRRGLVALVDAMPELEVAFETNSLRLLKNRVSEQATDIIIITEDDIDVIKSLIDDTRLETPPDVILIIHENVHNNIKKLTNIGVKSILTEYCDEDEIKTALLSVSNGKRFFCDRILDSMIDKDGEQTKAFEPELLSQREQEVLQLIVKGNSTVDIAEKLFVSVHTINSHRKNILKKLNLKSPTQLILYAVEKGLI